MKKYLLLVLVGIFSCLQLSAQSSNNASPKHEFRATWFTTWAGDWQKIYAVDNAKMVQQQNALKACFDSLARCNVNAVCFQVRSRSDVFYESSYEPWAKELTGTLGKYPLYDPLKFAIDEAHKRGMELHAWVNPFRLSSATDSRKTEVDVKDLYKAPDGKKLQWSWVIPYDNASFTGQIIDPGFPEARKYVVNVLMEIVNKYDIDGIVMDDYFYGYGGTADNQDQTSQSAYFNAEVVEDENGDGKKMDDWRRSNVDAVIEAMYDSIQIVKPWVRFGMGPGGIWSTNDKVYNKYEIRKPQNIDGAADPYTLLYCNTVKWVKEGWVDYVNPQIYWSTTISKFNYKVLCEWWAKDVCEHFSNKLEGNQRVHFYPSQTADKAFTTDNSGTNVGFGTTDEEGIEEIIKQINTNRNHLSSGYTGSVFFKNSTFLKMSDMVASACYQQKALVPPMAWKATEALVAPNTLRISGNTLTWQHASADRFTVYIYPKNVHINQAIEESYYLQGVVYGKSFALPNSFDITTHNVAVRAYDRYGVEHAPAEYGPDVTYVLNGGIVEKLTPTNAELWEAFKPYYNTFYGEARSDQPITAVATFMTKGEKIMTDASSEYKWLGDYILKVTNEQIADGTLKTYTGITTEVKWRFAVQAFFNCSAAKDADYSGNADFTEAGKPENWGPYYLAAHSNTNVEPQPENAELWTSFKPYYNTYYGLSRADQTIENVASFAAEKMQDIMTNNASEYKWLGDYISSVVSAQVKPALSSESDWRWAVHAFFNCYDGTVQGTQKVATANFSTAGQPAAWKAAWDAAHPATPADPETSTYTLPDFIETALTLPTEDSRPVYITHPNEYTFAGWIDQTGASITELSVGYKGTVYAQWNSPIKWVLNGGAYTGHHELPLTVDEEYYLPTAFAMRKEGYKFAGWYDNASFTDEIITTIPANYTGTLYAKWGEATHVTWHPYPYYDVTNEDLWELFMEDYNAFYLNKDILGEKVSSGAKSYQPMTGAFGFTFSLAADKEKDGFRDGRLKDFMTHPKSPWRWLGDYITEVLEEENESLDSNAPLWTSFKEATGLTHLGALETMDFETICGPNALYSYRNPDTQEIKTNADGSTEATILNALFAKEEWKWMKTYIMDVQNKATGATRLPETIGDSYDSNRAWAFAVAAFFLQKQRTDWPKTADFSTAGKHSVWKEIIPEEYHDLGHFRITNELEWRKTVAAFFNHTNVLTYTLNSGVSKTEGTADFRNLGLPKPNGDPAAGWYNAWWNATFPEYMMDNEALPKVKRCGYVFGGWYYGNEKGYIFTEGTKANPDDYSPANDDYKNHLWGRWLELCLYEGYVDSDPAALDANEQPISPKVNNNVEMVICNAEEIARTGLSRKVDIERKLTGGTYNTMFLPFGINGQGTVKKDDDGNYISGSGICGKKYYLNQVIDDDGNPLLDPATTSILVYDGAEVETIGGEKVIAFNFHEYAETDSLEPLGVYQPILIKPENDITTRMHFWSALMWKPATPKARTDASQANVEGVLAPTMLPINSEYDNTLILVADNRLAKVTTQGEMLGLRLYFTVPKDVSPSARSIIRVNNAPTGIDDIETPQQGAAVIKIMQNGNIYIIRNGKMYDIMGREIGDKR